MIANLLRLCVVLIVNGLAIYTFGVPRPYRHVDGSVHAVFDDPPRALVQQKKHGTGATDGAQFIDAASGRSIIAFLGGSRQPWAVSLSHGLIAGYADFDTFSVYDVTAKGIRWRHHFKEAVRGPVSFSPNGRWLSVGQWPRTFIFATDTGKLVRAFHDDTDGVFSFFSPFNEVLLNRKGDLVCCDIATNQETLIGNADSIVFAEDGSCAAALLGSKTKSTLRTWDWKRRELLFEVDIKDETFTDIQISPRGSFIAGHDGYPVAFSFAGSRSDTVHLWNVQSGKKIASFPSWTFGREVLFTDDETLLYQSRSSKTVSVLNTRSLKSRFDLPVREFDDVNFLQGLEPGQVFVYGSEECVCVDLTTGTSLFSFPIDGDRLERVDDLMVGTKVGRRVILDWWGRRLLDLILRRDTERFADSRTVTLFDARNGRTFDRFLDRDSPRIYANNRWLVLNVVGDNQSTEIWRLPASRPWERALVPAFVFILSIGIWWLDRSRRLGVSSNAPSSNPSASSKQPALASLAFALGS